MAQIKKHQDGGKATRKESTYVEKPIDAVTTPVNQLTFNVDGQEHKINESDFTAIADKAFSEEVRKGKAKLKDRSKWLNVFQTKLQEAKTGRFNIQSSGDAVSNISYTPADSNYDASASDGVGTDGNAAQRTGLGRILAPKASGSEDYMASILNNYIGEGVVANRKSYLQIQSEKASADKTKLTENYNDFVKRDANNLSSASLGNLAFGKDWSDPEARKLILNKVWGKEPGHVANIDSAFQKHVGKVFDTYYDDKMDDYMKAGVDIKAIRDRFSSIYDPNTKTFKTPLKGIGDLYRYSDALDTLSSDSPLFNKSNYQSLISGASSTGSPNTNAVGAESVNPVTTNPAENPNKRTITGRSGDLYIGSDGRYFADKELTRTVTGKWTDGKYYSSGHLRNGKYAPTETGLDGKPSYNYYSPEAGYYVDGAKANKDLYSAYINKLATDPKRKNDYDRIVNHDKNIDTNFANNNFVGLMSNGFLNDSNILNHGEYAFKGFGTDFKPAGAANISSMFTRGKAPIKGGVFAFQSNNENHLGIPDAETAVVTDDGYNFRGVMRKGADGKFKLYSKGVGNTLVENKDPNLQRFLNGLEADESKLDNSSLTNMLLNRTRFQPADTPVSRERNFLQRVIPGFQIGGRLGRRLEPNEDPNKVSKSTPTKYKSTAGSNLFKEGYEMSGQEKLEAAALAADVTGLALSFTGAGSVPSAVIGAAGTSAQLAADVSRDGLDWGDARRAAVGFGLDAASAIPGLGLVGKGGKTVNTIKRSAKWLIPALAAAGATQAVGVVSDIVSGKKSATDLNIDDMRALTNGLHAGLGGARMLNNSLAIKKTNTSKLALKDGSVELNPQQVNKLQTLSGEEKVTQAKLFAIENLNKQGKNISDVDLKQKKDGLLNRAKFWSNNGKLKEVVEVNTKNDGKAIKDLNDYQSDSLKDRYMRHIIEKASIRNPNLAIPEDINRANQWGFLGDYTRSNKNKPPYGGFSILPNKQLTLGSPTGQPLMGNNLGQISQNSVRKDILDITDWKKLKSNSTELGVKFNSKAGKPGIQTSLFKDGGIIKAQQGVKIPFLNTTQRFDMDSILGIPKTPAISAVLPPLGPTGITQPLTQSSIVPVKKEIPFATNISGTGNFWSKVKGLANKVNPHDVSEFARAMATRNVNRRIDTRVEAPMASAPVQIDVPVKGDLMARNSFYNRANDIITKGGQAITSDGQLFALQNLEANRQGAFLRAQGDAADYTAIDRSRMAALQNNMQNNAVRSDVANRNITTLANAKQAERGLENQKVGLVAQPFLSFWENKNAENLRKGAMDKQIDTQIALSSLSTNVNDMKAPIMKRANELYTKTLDPKLTPEQRQMYTEQYAAIKKQLESLGNAATNNALQLRKDLNYKPSSDYYSPYVKPIMAKGGKFENMFNKSANAAYKERLKDVRSELSSDAKANDKTMKDIQKLIKKALGK